jgi:hypothetical protein
MMWPCKKNEAYIITHGKTVYPGTLRQVERKELARYQKGKPVGRRRGCTLFVHQPARETISLRRKIPSVSLSCKKSRAERKI